MGTSTVLKQMWEKIVAAASRAFFAAVCCVFLSGCNREYRVQFRLEEIGEIRADSPVVLDGLQVGGVEEVVASPGDVLASATLDRRLLKDGALHVGVTATEGAKGSIVLDASKVATDAEELPSGATLVVTRELPVTLLGALQRYSATATLAGVACGLLVLCLIYFLFRKILHTAVIIACLAVACFVAFRFSPYVEPFVVRAYDKMERFEQSRDGGPETSVTRKLPKPRQTAFMAVWCVSFAAGQMVLGSIFGRGRKRRRGE